MARKYPVLTDELASFIREQKIFFTATAPSAADGRVNLSPKGYDTLRIFDPSTVGYLDYPGSGNKTALHLAENGRLTMMFCSFAERPLLLRLYGRGEVLERGGEKFRELGPAFGERFGPWVRQIILLHIEEVLTSCGEGVPFFTYQGEREDLHRWAVDLEEKGKLEEYVASHT